MLRGVWLVSTDHTQQDGGPNMRSPLHTKTHTHTHRIISGPELSPNSTVSKGNSEGFLRDVGSIGDHGCATLQEGAVGELLERGLVDFALSGDLGVLLQHVRARNADVGELERSDVQIGSVQGGGATVGSFQLVQLSRVCRNSGRFHSGALLINRNA